MTDAPEPRAHETGRGSHGLGPHVVGTRIVVRHLLPDGSATDVLGTCTAWGEASLTVERDGRGPARSGPVVIALADVVTGKPVPPRASVRARVSARECEARIAVLWTASTSEPLGEWLLRAAPPHGGRVRRRGNSALAMDEPGIGWADAVRRVRGFYAAREQAPTIQVQLGSSVEQTLAGFGFVAMGDGDSHAQLASVSSALRSLRPVVPDVAVDLDESVDRATATVEGGVATGTGVLSDDWLLIEGLVVAPDRRRRGLASGVLAELLDWGASRGARTAMLHVETANAGAIALYERHGFVTHHTNRYLIER